MSQTNWSVRACRNDEAERVVSLWRDAEATPSITDTPEHICRALANPAALLLVADLDGRLVGSVIATFDGWRGNMYRLAVHPTCRRRGIARALVREAESWLCHAGARRVTALVETDHPGAVGFWQAVGYGRQDRIARFVHNLT